MHKYLLILAMLLSAAVLPAHGEETAPTEGQPAPMFNPFDPLSWFGIPGAVNPYDPSTTTSSARSGAAVKNWHDPAAWIAAGKSPMMLNLAQPSGWAAFIDPRSHTGVHTALMNPATYAQFMQPNFWMQFMYPQNWMAWMNPASYTTFFDPATYLGWMNPAAYVHFMHPAMYLQPMNPMNYMPFLNPATYLSWMNPSAYVMPGAEGASTGFAWPYPSGGDQSGAQVQAESAEEGQ
jgi:hypothetical protein